MSAALKEGVSKLRESRGWGIIADTPVGGEYALFWNQKVSEARLLHKIPTGIQCSQTNEARNLLKVRGSNFGNQFNYR